LPGNRGRICWRRRFSRPTGLDPGEAVWLCIASRGAMLSVTLNGQPLASIEPTNALGEFEITARLRPRNELAVEAYRSAGTGTEPMPAKHDANVRLEIRRAI
jgi:hypothetical protein